MILFLCLLWCRGLVFLSWIVLFLQGNFPGRSGFLKLSLLLCCMFLIFSLCCLSLGCFSGSLLFDGLMLLREIFWWSFLFCLDLILLCIFLLCFFLIASLLRKLLILECLFLCLSLLCLFLSFLLICLVSLYGLVSWVYFISL